MIKRAELVPLEFDLVPIEFDLVPIQPTELVPFEPDDLLLERRAKKRPVSATGPTTQK